MSAPQNVPRSLPTPPRTTTINVSTIYFVPSVESIEKSNDIEQPAMPASPEPIPNVILSIFLVLIPRH